MVFIRKRYYIWLVRAYLKRWKNIILTFILLGSALFFVILIFFTSFIKPKLEKKTERIGISGTYTINSLPEDISSQISYGLTKIDKNGEIIPGAARSWDIKDSGKKYIFYLNNNLYFHNGVKLTSKTLDLTFKDAQKKDINDDTVEYILKESYSPFLFSVSKPIFAKDFSGLGEYKIINIDLNAGILKSISIQKISDSRNKKIYFFYPTQESLKIGFALGEIEKIQGITNLNFQNYPLSNWKNIKVTKIINYSRLFTIFYNNNDKNLSDKKIRQALNYALPSQFPQGSRTYSPFNPVSIFYEQNNDYSEYDMEIAKTFLGSGTQNTKIELSVQKDNLDTAKIIKEKWDELGVNTTIKIVDGIPVDYQAYLYSFKTTMNPDQYSLWHSDQSNNITHYNNKRIDKLLEDGRKLYDPQERINIYKDFQKYLLADTPASFLYFPYEYSLERILP